MTTVVLLAAVEQIMTQMILGDALVVMMVGDIVTHPIVIKTTQNLVMACEFMHLMIYLQLVLNMLGLTITKQMVLKILQIRTIDIRA